MNKEIFFVIELKFSMQRLGLYSLSGKTSYCKISKVSKSRDSSLDFSNSSEIWQAPDSACQVSERCDDYNTQSRGFETSRDLAVRRLTA